MKKKSLIGKRQTVKKALVANKSGATSRSLKPKSGTQPATYAPGLLGHGTGGSGGTI